MVVAKVTNDFVTYPHNALSSAALYLKERIDRAHQPDGDMKGVTLDMIAALTMSAFSLEGYVNYVGERVLVGRWDDRTSVKAKIKCLKRELGLTFDWNKRPYSTIKKLVWIRNAFAHPKPHRPDPREYVAEGTFDGLKRGLRDYQPGLMLAVTHDFVTEAFHDVEEIWLGLLTAAGIGEYETWDGGSQGIEILGDIEPLG